MTPGVLITADIRELRRVAARLFAGAAQRSAGQEGPFAVAPSEGSTPRGRSALRADDASPKESVPWERIRFFWSDERCVGPEGPGSNYRMAGEVRLSTVPVRPSKIHRIRGENDSPSASAAAYEKA